MTLRGSWSRGLAAAVATLGTTVYLTLSAAQGVSAAGAAQAAAGASRSVKDGVYTVDQAKRGRALYDRRCVLCHLERGQGNASMPEIVGQSLEREGDALAPAVAGDAFLQKWGGRNAWELFSVMTSTMPVGGAKTLSPQEYADVLAYLLELSRLPAGSQELTSAREQLEPIAFAK